MDDAMSTPLEPATEAFWRQYLNAAPDATAAQRWFYESFRIGTSVESGNEGALLISRGIKTTTSSLLWEYEAEHKPLPQVGSLSILKDGHEQAVCVVETTELVTRAFRDVDARFAYDYGDGPHVKNVASRVLAILRRTVRNPRAGAGAHHAPRLRTLPRRLRGQVVATTYRRDG